MNEVRITAKENVVVNGVKFMAQPPHCGCRGCAFGINKKFEAVCDNVICNPNYRHDGRSVIFVKKKKKKKNPWIPTNGVIPNFTCGTAIEWKDKQGHKDICLASVLPWNFGATNEITHYRVIAQSQSDS